MELGNDETKLFSANIVMITYDKLKSDGTEKKINDNLAKILLA